MKKLATHFLAILVVFTLVACDSNNSTQTINTNGRSVETCYTAIIHSKSADEMAPYVSVGNAADYYANVEKLFGDDSFSVRAEPSGNYNNYEVFYITVTSKNDKNKTMSNFELFQKKNNDYYLVLDADTISEINRECVCKTCGGTGGTTTGQNVCGICCGTGVQTIPNAYYDAALGTWMPQTIGCGGCGGSGHIGMGSSNPCHTCHGRRYVFD